MAILACAKIGGSFEKMGMRVGAVFTTITMIVLSLLLGPVAAIPRTAATTFELGVLPILPGASHAWVSVAYFAVVLFFVLRPTKIVDMIGKILTPFLLLSLLSLIVMGMVSPIGIPAATSVENAFATAFSEGYNTMDALAGVIMAAIPLAAVSAKGYKDPAEKSKVLVFSGMISSAGLAIIYGGMMFLGSQTSGLDLEGLSRIQLVIRIVTDIFGPGGVFILSFLTTLACLSTAIVLMIISSDFFTKIFKNRVPYPVVALVLTAISYFISLLNVDQIISLVSPALYIIYPMIIVLVACVLLGLDKKHGFALKTSVYFTLGFSVISVTGAWLDLGLVSRVMARLPFHESGFDWVLPAILVFMAAVLITPRKQAGGQPLSRLQPQKP